MIHPVLRRYGPPESQILLLVVALGAPAAAERAWRQWAARHSVEEASWAEIRLLAAVARRLKQIDPTSPWLSRLEGIRRFAWTNTQICANAARPLLAALRAADIRVMLIKGAARLALDPSGSADRLVRDIDVLVHPADWPRALDLANRNGWRSPLWTHLAPRIFPHHHAVMIRGADGGTIDLHHLALYMCRNLGDDDGLWERAGPAIFRRIALLAPSPADELVLAISHGMLSGPEPVADWVLDVACLLRSGKIDWAVVEAEVRARDLDLFVAAGLLLMADRLGLPVPRQVLERMLPRVREPFITDFRSFATVHQPSEPWMIDCVRSAAALRALSAARRIDGIQTEGRSSLPPPHRFPAIPSTGEAISIPVPCGFDRDTLLVLAVSFTTAAQLGTILEIAAPGLVLKHWLCRGGPEASQVNIEVPAALFAMRCIECIQIRALHAGADAPFTDVTAHWTAFSLKSSETKILDDKDRPFTEDVSVENGKAASNKPTHPLADVLGLFDPSWYLEKYPAAALFDGDPLWEYFQVGGLEGRIPGPSFDAADYWSRYPDIARAGANPLLHYSHYGYAEGRTANPFRLPEAATDSDSPGSSDELRSLVERSGCFDEGFYCSQYPEAAYSGIDPLAAFLHGGWRMGRSPGPTFDVESYLRHNPDIAAAGINPLVHYLLYGRKEGRSPCVVEARVSDAVRIALRELVKAEPELERHPSFRDPGWLVPRNPYDAGRVGKAFSAFFRSLEKAYDRIIFVPWLIRGGADVVAVMLGREVVETDGAVLLLATDTDHAVAQWLPPGIDLRVFSVLDADLTPGDRTRLVVTIVQALQPKAIMNINSRSCWDAFADYGRRLAESCDLFAMLFARDYDAWGRPAGYSDTHLRRCLPVLKRVYCDTQKFPADLTAAFDLTDTARAKLAHVRPPPEENIVAWNRVRNGSGQKFQVLWAGRLAREKNIELLVEICRLAPDMDFQIYGGGSDQQTSLLKQAAEDCSNIRPMGEFDSFRTLPIGRCDVFLYTSRRDGMPRSLVNAGASGIPIVASDVGGIGELIDQTTGWLVRDAQDAFAYVEALRAVRDSREEADRRRYRLLERVAREHNRPHFRDGLRAAPGFLAAGS